MKDLLPGRKVKAHTSCLQSALKLCHNSPQNKLARRVIRGIKFANRAMISVYGHLFLARARQIQDRGLLINNLVEVSAGHSVI